MKHLYRVVIDVYDFREPEGKDKSAFEVDTEPKLSSGPKRKKQAYDWKVRSWLEPKQFREAFAFLDEVHEILQSEGVSKVPIAKIINILIRRKVLSWERLQFLSTETVRDHGAVGSKTYQAFTTLKERSYDRKLSRSITPDTSKHPKAPASGEPTHDDGEEVVGP